MSVNLSTGLCQSRKRMESAVIESAREVWSSLPLWPCRSESQNHREANWHFTVFMEVCLIWYAGTSMRQHAIYVVNSHGLFWHVVNDEWLRMPMWVSPSKPPKVFIHASISFTRPAQLQFITLFNPHHGSAQSDKFDIIWCFCSGHTCWKRMKTQGEGIDCQEYVVPEEGVRFGFSQCNSHPSAAVLGKSRAQSTLVVWWKNINPMMLLMDKIKLTSSVEMVKTLCRWIP